MCAEQTTKTGAPEAGNKYAGKKSSYAFASARDSMRVPMQR